MLDSTSILPSLPMIDEDEKRRRALATLPPAVQQAVQAVGKTSPMSPTATPTDNQALAASSMKPAAESVTPPPAMATPVNLPAVGNKISPQLQGAQDSVTAARDRYTQADATASKHHGILRNILDAIGSFAAPGLMMNIPGTRLHNNYERKFAMEALNNATGEEREQAQVDHSMLPPQPTNDFELWHQQNPQGTAEEFLKMQEGTKPPAKVDDFQAYLNDVAASQGKKPEQLTPQERLKARSDYQSAGRAEPKQNDFEQYYKDFLTEGNLPDSAHNRLMARREFAKAGQPFGQIHIDMQQAAASDKKKEAGQGKADKANAPYQDALDAAQEAHEYAAMGTGEGDYALTLRFVEATKPKTGFRLTNTEFNAIKGARSSLGDFEALVQKVQGGQSLTPEQRQQMLQIIDTHAATAKQKMAENNKHFGVEEAAPEQPAAGGIQVIRDANGRISGIQ